ncbi:MAG: T9SS type A sorting domain-containing protein [Taibaiella sp.]|nr:T9SS type A sorting domain-containing protein [Taibaiella sp.]
MKKLYFLLSALAIGYTGQAQTVPNAGFETWRTNSIGSGTSAILVKAPLEWYGADSLIIGFGRLLGGALGIPDSVWKQQVFKDSTTVHGGNYAARLVTKDQDTLGIFPGILSNAIAHVSFSGITFNGIYYTGGTPVTNLTQTVSAWVKYTAGAALDSGLLSVQVLSNIGGIDSVVGTGTAKIAPNSAYTQVTANITYQPIAGLVTDTIRITFSSSAGGHNAVGSTMLVDDVTMTGIPFSVSVNDVNTAANLVTVYPNPAADVLNIELAGSEPVTFTLMSLNGSIAAQTTVSHSKALNVAALAAGFYFYTVTDKEGNIAQRGKVSLMGN